MTITATARATFTSTDSQSNWPGRELFPAVALLRRAPFLQQQGRAGMRPWNKDTKLQGRHTSCDLFLMLRTLRSTLQLWHLFPWQLPTAPQVQAQHWPLLSPPSLTPCLQHHTTAPSNHSQCGTQLVSQLPHKGSQVHKGLAQGARHGAHAPLQPPQQVLQGMALATAAAGLSIAVAVASLRGDVGDEGAGHGGLRQQWQRRGVEESQCGWVREIAKGSSRSIAAAAPRNAVYKLAGNLL